MAGFHKSVLPLCFPLLFIAFPALSVDDEQLVDADVDALGLFTIVDDMTDTVAAESLNHALVQENVFTLEGKRYVRYQQYYKGLKVEGRSVVGHYGDSHDEWLHGEGRFFGKLTEGISNLVPGEYLTDDFREGIVAFAQQHYSDGLIASSKIVSEDSQPMIWIDEDEEARLAYQVSFRVQPSTGLRRWPHYIISANDNEILEYWDNVQSLYSDKAPGGNNKTGRYHYGTDNMPAFTATDVGSHCLLGNSQVKVVSLNGGWSLDSNPKAYTYTCGNNNGDPVNGGWSPANDAYVFSNLVVDMFQDWYKTPVLALPNGQPKQLLVLVNVGKNYENAFWDGRYLAFGDGHTSYYPMVSLAIVAHELSHAFTSAHSRLVYANQSGAVNEAFADMAAIAAEAYLKSFNIQAYQSILGGNDIDWRIGDRISKGNFAIRSMSNPAVYSSAECEVQVSGCRRSWSDIQRVSSQIPVGNRQSYIVHKGSGIMNRAFVNIVNALGGNVNQAFSLMVRANMTYWTSTATFSEAACGIKQAAQVENVSTRLIQNAFRQVGVIPSC